MFTTNGQQRKQKGENRQTGKQVIQKNDKGGSSADDDTIKRYMGLLRHGWKQEAQGTNESKCLGEFHAVQQNDVDKL